MRRSRACIAAGHAGSTETPRRLRAAGAQPSQSDRDEPADRGLGRQAAGCGKGVQAIARELIRRDIIPEVTGLGPFGEQILDHVAKPLLRSGGLLASTQERREFGAVVRWDSWEIRT